MRRFIAILSEALGKRHLELGDFYNSESPVEATLLAEYGAIFAARGGAVPAPVLVFKKASDVDQFQASLSISRRKIGNFELELQTPAMNALQKAVAGAAARNLSINPRGADSARRDYDGTVELWASRVNPALDYWTKEGKLSIDESSKIRALEPFEQVAIVFELEKKGIFFSKDLSKPVMYSVAPPGASQHLALLAFDVAEYKNAEVRRILADQGWFQTVVSDLPHFTYLGVKEEELPELGLQKVENAGQTFWIPD